MLAHRCHFLHSIRSFVFCFLLRKMFGKCNRIKYVALCRQPFSLCIQHTANTHTRKIEQVHFSQIAILAVLNKFSSEPHTKHIHFAHFRCSMCRLAHSHWIFCHKWHRITSATHSMRYAGSYKLHYIFIMFLIYNWMLRSDFWLSLTFDSHTSHTFLPCEGNANAFASVNHNQKWEMCNVHVKREFIILNQKWKSNVNILICNTKVTHKIDNKMNGILSRFVVRIEHSL